jgi:hypothetical protein
MVLFPTHAKKRFPNVNIVEIPARAEIDLRSPAKKRFQVIAQNRMTSASGFTWFAREQKLIVGAEGRASSQRSIEYHSPSRLRQKKFDLIWRSQAALSSGPGGRSFLSAHAPVRLDATCLRFDARDTGDRKRAGLAGIPSARVGLDTYSNGFDGENFLAKQEFNPIALEESILAEQSQAHWIHSLCEARIGRKNDAVA